MTGALETGLAGVKRGQVKLDSTARPFNLIAQTVENVLNTGSATFSWRELISDKPLTDSDRRAFIEFKPILDFNALEPGKAATDAIRQAANDLHFAGEYGARVRLTGPVPIANEEFATVQDGAIGTGSAPSSSCCSFSGWRCIRRRSSSRCSPISSSAFPSPPPPA